MPKVSIILPIYNVADYLEKCFDSLVNQTLKDIEIICVDDCSTDNSAQIIQKYSKYDKRFVYYRQRRNQGPGAARNKGIKLAKGEYLMFLDPDDWFENETCELAYNRIKSNNNDIVLFNYNIYYEEDGNIEYKDIYTEAFKDVIDNHKIRLYEDLANNYIKTASIWLQIYNRDFIIKNKITYPNLYHAEDVPFYVKAMICADTVSFINKPLYNYRLRSDSLTRTRSFAYKYFFSSRDISYKYVKKYGKGTHLNAFLIYYIRSLWFWYKHLEDPDIKRKYYKQMHKVYKTINEAYNVEKIRDYINYEKFLEIAETSWNQKYNIIFEIPNVFRVYINQSGNISFLIGREYRISLREVQQNTLRRIFSIANRDGHKIIYIMFFKIKIKRKKKY